MSTNENIKKNVLGRTDFHISAIRGDISEMETHIKSGIDIDIRSTAGLMTPLLDLSRSSHCKLHTVKYLVDNGADINAVNVNGQNALFNVTNTEVLKYFIENGVDVDQKDKNGLTPLIFALNNRNSYIRYEHSKILLENGANPNVVTKSGQTPLTKAYKDYVKNNDANLVELLLYYGADPDWKYKDDKSFRDMTLESDQNEILELIDSYSGGRATKAVY